MVSTSTHAQRRLSALVIALAVALLTAACGGAGGDGDTSGAEGGETTAPSPGESGSESTPSATGVPQETGLVGITETDAEPRQGGTLSLAVYAEARGLDPAQAPSSGVLGAMEVAAIYDVLVRYDPETGEYEPWMATSLEHSEDYGTWTLGLREGVQFSDGTPLNAEAVVFSFDRAKDGRYGPLVSQIASMETPDEHTVVFHLNKPWSRFPYVLSTGPGRVPSPTAVKKWGEDFGTHPVGAGPFTLERFAQGEEMVLAANENYWGEGPYLDKLRFVPLDGAQAKLDSLESGGIQAAFIRDAEVIADARQAGYGGFVNVVSTGEMLLINNAEGTAGADQRVRKAIAYAINSDQLNQRVFDGKGLVQKEWMAETSQWATETEATPYDPEKAKALLAEAKADGYDGTLTLSANSAPTRQAAALTLQAQLNAVGFETELKTVPTAGALFGQVLKGNYELSFYGVSITDAAPWVKLTFTLKTDGSTNRMGYSNPQMDALLSDLHDATSEQGKQQALNDIQALATETVPSIPLEAVPEFIAWDDSVHGIVPTVYTSLLFSQAWLSN